MNNPEWVCSECGEPGLFHSIKECSNCHCGSCMECWYRSKGCPKCQGSSLDMQDNYIREKRWRASAKLSKTYIPSKTDDD